MLYLARRLAVRPQRGVLVLAALAPFDGLLLLFDTPDIIGGWKEILVLLTVGATFVAPRGARNVAPGLKPAWLAAIVGLMALSLLTTLWVSPAVAISGFKIDYFYLLLVWAIWRCPLTATDRDRLVTILMIGGVLTSIMGVAQQLLGADFLNALGYEFNTVIRTTGDSVLRSFSTFDLPFPFAFYVVFVLAVSVPVALNDPTRLRNRLFLLATPLMVAGLLSAVVRAAVLAIIVASAYHVARRYRAVLSLAPLAIMVLVLTPAALWGPVLSSNSLGQRYDGWSVVADTVIDRPLGAGIGTTGAAAEAATDLEGPGAETFGLRPDRLPYQPDNYYIKRLLELGPLGLWLTLVMLRHVVGSAVAARSRAEPGDQALIDGILASVLGAIAAAFVATYWEIFPLDLYFWMMLGVLTSIDRAESRSPRSPSDQRAAEYKPILASS